MNLKIDKIDIDDGLLERFWSKVSRGGRDDCWNWVASTRRRGYGQFQYKYKMLLAHRVALMLDGVDIPDGMLVCHKCDNTGCVNPNHLFIGSPSDNSADMVSKGRSAKCEANPRAKLSREDVRWIRSSGLSQRHMAKILGVSQSTVSDAFSGKGWRGISDRH